MELENKNTQNQQGRKNPRSFYYTKHYKKNYSKRPDDRANVVRTKFKKLSVVIPLLDEEESLTPLTHEIIKVCKGINIDYEILFVDDGSKDKSLEMIRSLAQRFHKVRYLSFRRNYGKSAALHVGFKHITGDVVITMDADLQDDPNEIPNLLKKLEEGFDLVSGWKKKRYDPFIKRNTSKFFNFITRVMTGIKLHDFNCGLKAYRSEVVKDIKIYGELHRYIPALAGWKGFRVGEISVKHHPRRFGKTKFGISRFYKGMLDLLTVLFTTKYNRRPMHLFGFLGAVSFFIGFIVNAYLTYLWISGEPLTGRPLLFLGILLIIVGVQFFSVGLLSEIMVHNFRDDDTYSINEMK